MNLRHALAYGGASQTSVDRIASAPPARWSIAGEAQHGDGEELAAQDERIEGAWIDHEVDNAGT
jgi:hypothetical protein